MRKLAFLVLFFILTLSLYPTTYFVKNGGNDGADGLSEANAWETLNQANITLTAGDTVRIMAGTYSGNINPTNSGTSGNPITYIAYGDGAVIISNFQTLTGWDVHAGNVYVTDYAETWYSSLWEDDYETSGYNVALDHQASIVAVDAANEYYLDSGNLKIYAWTANGDDPDNHTMRLGKTKGASLSSDDYITIDGLYFKWNQRGVDASNCDYVIVQNCTIEYSGAYGIFFAGTSSYCQAIDNTIWNVGSWYGDDGDGIHIGGTASYNLVQGNDVSITAHNGIVAYGAGSQPHNNVYEDNIVHECGSSGINMNVHPYSEVVRRNRSYDNTGAGIQTDSSNNVYYQNTCWHSGYIEDANTEMINVYSVASSDTDDNYFFHNTGYDAGGHGVAMYEYIPGSATNDDNEFKNNIFQECDTASYYIIRVDALDFRNNEWAYNIVYDADSINVNYTGDGVDTLTNYETNYAANFNNNIQSDPTLVDPTNGGMTLQAGSPAIDAGVFLTTTNGTGSASTTLIVDDSRYFMDGYGITTGDTIQLDGQTTTSLVTNINYGTHTLTLQTALTWADEVGVALVYFGTAPDIGAEESGAVDTHKLVIGSGTKLILGSGVKVVIK